MSEKQKREIIAQEWIVRFDGQIKRQEERLIIESNDDNVKDK